MPITEDSTIDKKKRLSFRWNESRNSNREENSLGGPTRTHTMRQFQWKMLNGSTLVTIERLIEVFSFTLDLLDSFYVSYDIYKNNQLFF